MVILSILWRLEKRITKGWEEESSKVHTAGPQSRVGAGALVSQVGKNAQTKEKGFPTGRWMATQTNLNDLTILPESSRKTTFYTKVKIPVLAMLHDG